VHKNEACFGAGTHFSATQQWEAEIVGFGGTIMSLRTTPPPTYLPPTQEEMKVAAQQAGVRKFAPHLVEDIVNLAAGGQINPPSTYRQIVEKWAEDHLSAPDSEGRWYINGQYTKDRASVIRDAANKRMQYHQSVCYFLRSLDIDGLPGHTLLDQAMTLLKLLATQRGGENSGGDGQSDLMPIFSDNDNPEGTAAKINEAVDTVDSLSEDEKQLISDDDSSSDGDGSGGSDPAQTRKLAEDMLKGKEVMLEISRHLDKLTRMQVRKQRKVEPDPIGEEVRNRPMKHLGEIGRIPQSEWALPRPYRMFRHITGQTQVRERCTRIEKKQLLYIIVDCSGSMGSGQRIYKAGGIIMNRLKAVIAGEAELYIRMFDTSLKKEYHAATPEEAREVMKQFTEKNYSGGGTDIPACSKAAQKRIDEIIAAEGAYYRPELVVITDGGDDTSSLSVSDFPGTKLHAFVVECKNQNLTKLAERSGGVGVENM
jgi:hypothetical protein